jgi:hypothetical protein
MQENRDAASFVGHLYAKAASPISSSPIVERRIRLFTLTIFVSNASDTDIDFPAVKAEVAR